MKLHLYPIILTFVSVEKKWLKQFFDTVVGCKNSLNTLSCDQFNQYFLLSNSKCPSNIIQTVWNELAGESNPKFVIMSSYLNSNAKGMFFPEQGNIFQHTFVNDPKFSMPQGGQGWTWPTGGFGGVLSAKDALVAMSRYFEVVLYGVLEMKADNMLSLIDETNNGIYNALQVFQSTLCASF